MNTILLVGLMVGAPPDHELERARAVVAVELAKIKLREVAAPTLPTDPSQPAPVGYKWIKRGDGPWKLERDVPGVAVPKGNTFPGKPSAGGYNGSHRCTNCGHQSAPGTGTWVVRGTNRDGTHSHACPVCNDHWRH